MIFLSSYDMIYNWLFMDNKNEMGVASVLEYLNSLRIDSLRGVRNLAFSEFTAVNLITGPNACGKSTVLDAIELITNPTQAKQFLKLSNASSSGFFYLFDKKEIRPYCRVSGVLLDKPYFTELASYETVSGSTFRGYHYYMIPKNGVPTNHTREVEFNIKDDISIPTTSSMVNVQRISDNFKSTSLANILKDKTVYEKVLSVLSLFDNRIIAIDSPDFKNTYVSHEVYGNLDETFFSMGIRKFLNLASQMADFRDGILLIDDFEAHLSPGTLYETVSLVYSLAKERNIQLFITTHSQELIDEWLDIMNFYHKLSDLKIIRMKSDGTLSSHIEFWGKEAYELRMEHEWDFRYEHPKKGEINERIF